MRRAPDSRPVSGTGPYRYRKSGDQEIHDYYPAPSRAPPSEPEGVGNSDPSCGDVVVLADHAAEHSTASDPTRRNMDRCDMEGVRCGKIDPTVRSVRVVVALVGRKHPEQVSSTGHQGQVDDLGSGGPDEALGEGVGLRGAHRRLQHPGPFGSKHLVESRVLRVPVANQEVQAGKGIGNKEVAGLLVAQGESGLRVTPLMWIRRE